jgi:hypothetical protein
VKGIENSIFNYAGMRISHLSRYSEVGEALLIEVLNDFDIILGHFQVGKHGCAGLFLVVLLQCVGYASVTPQGSLNTGQFQCGETGFGQMRADGIKHDFEDRVHAVVNQDIMKLEVYKGAVFDILTMGFHFMVYFFELFDKLFVSPPGNDAYNIALQTDPGYGEVKKGDVGSFDGNAENFVQCLGGGGLDFRALAPVQLDEPMGLSGSECFTQAVAAYIEHSSQITFRGEVLTGLQFSFDDQLFKEVNNLFNLVAGFYRREVMEIHAAIIQQPIIINQQEISICLQRKFLMMSLKPSWIVVFLNSLIDNVKIYGNISVYLTKTKQENV